MSGIPTIIDNFLDAIQAIVLSFLVKLGPFAVALMPALFTAYAIFYTFEGEAGANLAFAFAVVVGLGIETVGIVATHTAIDLYNGKQSGIIDAGKYWLMVLLVPVYIFGVAGTVWYAEQAFSPLVRALGIASPFLTCIVYIAVALARDLSNIQRSFLYTEQRSQAQELDKIQHERILELKKLELEYNLKIRELDNSAKVQIEQSKVQIEQAKQPALSQLAEIKQPALSQQFSCPDCPEIFGTIQALNAHKRWCKGEPVFNGNHK